MADLTRTVIPLIPLLVHQILQSLPPPPPPQPTLPPPQPTPPPPQPTSPPPQPTSPPKVVELAPDVSIKSEPDIIVVEDETEIKGNPDDKDDQIETDVMYHQHQIHYHSRQTELERIHRDIRHGRVGNQDPRQFYSWVREKHHRTVQKQLKYLNAFQSYFRTLPEKYFMRLFPSGRLEIKPRCTQELHELFPLS